MGAVEQKQNHNDLIDVFVLFFIDLFLLRCYRLYLAIRISKSCTSARHCHTTPGSRLHSQTITCTRMFGSTTQGIISHTTCFARTSSDAIGSTTFSILQATTVMARSGNTVNIWVNRFIFVLQASEAIMAGFKKKKKKINNRS